MSDNKDEPISLLIASPQLTDPNFAKSVVLLIEHDAEGAMGFVVNRPSPHPVADLIADESVVMPRGLASWYGGPVGKDQGLIIHAEGVPDAESRDYGGVHVSGGPVAIEALAAFGQSHEEAEALAQGTGITAPRGPWLYPFRFVVGYAGWGAGQLEEEMVEGAWIPLTLDRMLLFATPWLNMWPTALARLGVSPANFAPSPHPYVH